MKTCLLIPALLWGTTAWGGTNYIGVPYNAPNAGLFPDPFTTFDTRAPSVRYQQVYASSEFTRWTANPGQITEISFSTGFMGIDISVPEIQINFSTTQKQPNALSASFSQNVGADSQTVFFGPLHLLGNGSGTFDVHIPLQPFLYDPAQGNLLVEVRNFQSIPLTSLSHLLLAVGIPPVDTTSIAIALDVNSDIGTLRGTGALATEFTMVDVPEPSTWSLLALFGPAALAAPHYLRRRAADRSSLLGPTKTRGRSNDKR